MAVPLYIPPCIHNPTSKHHLPPHDQPLRIQIEGPLVAIQRILPDIPWHLSLLNRTFPQPAGPELARLTYQQIYERDTCLEVAGDLMMRDEYLGWVPENVIDYYGVTFDHLVPLDEPNPEVLQINIIEIEDDNGADASTGLLFAVGLVEYIRKKVLAVPRCCQPNPRTPNQAHRTLTPNIRTVGGRAISRSVSNTDTYPAALLEHVSSGAAIFDWLDDLA
ncbi:hypothetical protein ANOM_005222 [Aspergillus nomiae NRRL 13137]|uniref:Uncharacterized protein n=1 Tax=Aspergillus nomiae NRRL (strain ATCC 15546 / NRRL 13137 / CBS 260.88 / M93) TaxID=1509407 RepID=A0A0L1J4H5_ASPN3|nr:uncharacterized protein ANOM_005222 [Aspergillus nomiae NRRL 13137]KNG86328.1 hypothetical protein ANOM_005222 [Aspergillus nomiae NRRL 13137]